MQLLNNPNINFINKTKYSFIISIIFIMLGIISLVINQGPSLSIDFTGGNIAQLKFENAVNISDIRLSLINNGLPGSEIIEFGNPNEILIKTSSGNTNNELLNILKNTITIPFTIERFEKIGPKIGAELRSDAINAIIIALLLITIYISFRFDRFYAFGSVLAIIHDVVFTLGIFSILQLEIDLSIIAAFLTIVGYSLNDTIVIFDRFRENSEKDLDLTPEELANLSLNQTLSRTIITSLTTLMVVIILYYIGGEVIKYFAFALIVGVLVGTYSSMFVASPFMLYLRSKYKIEEE